MCKVALQESSNNNQLPTYRFEIELSEELHIQYRTLQAVKKHIYFGLSITEAAKRHKLNPSKLSVTMKKMREDGRMDRIFEALEAYNLEEAKAVFWQGMVDGMKAGNPKFFKMYAEISGMISKSPAVVNQIANITPSTEQKEWLNKLDKVLDKR